MSASSALRIASVDVRRLTNGTGGPAPTWLGTGLARRSVGEAGGSRVSPTTYPLVPGTRTPYAFGRTCVARASPIPPEDAGARCRWGQNRRNTLVAFGRAVHIFLIGWREQGRVESQGAAGALRGLAAELTPLDPDRIEHWESPDGSVLVEAVSHPPEQLSIAYSHFEPSRMALFAGRPIVWRETGEADGREALDARFYLAPPEAWMHSLDGPCAVVRYDEASGSLDVYTDPLGAYPVYSARAADGTLWLTNKPVLLTDLLALGGFSARALASFFTCSWAFGGETIWEGIDRLPRASLHQFRRAGGHQSLSLLPTGTIASYFGSGANSRESARTLVATVRAGADWPGRPVRVPLSSGRDSRVVFAAAVAAGVEFEATTIAFPHAAGFPETLDVTLARQLAAECGHEHAVTRPEPGLGIRDTARLLRLLSNGAVSVGATGAFTPPGASSPLPIVMSGRAGEISRAYYGIGVGSAAEIAQSIYRHLVPSLPRPLVTGDAEELVRTYVVDWVNEKLDEGIAAADIPDTFYLLEKLAHWGGASQSVYEWTSDTFAPLWSARLLPHELGLPPEQRERELFHLGILEELSPALARIPFNGVPPRWPGFPTPRSNRVQHYRVLASKVAQELRRRAQAHLARSTDARDAFTSEALFETRRYARDYPSHPAWDVLDRKRVVRLLSKQPRTFDPRSRRYLLGLATIFAAE